MRSTVRSSSQSATSSQTRQNILDGLRQRIRQIENRTPQFSVSACAHSQNELAAGSPSGLPVEDGGIFPCNARTPMSSSSPISFNHPGKQPGSSSQPGRQQLVNAWTLGNASLDYLVGPHGLEADGVHELKPYFAANENDQRTSNWAARWSAARLFLLALLNRRFAALGAEAQQSGPGILWCWPRIMAQEFGDLYDPGLEAPGPGVPGIKSTSITIVEPARSQDVLWAMEEGLKSNALACVVGVLDDVDLTPARRLALVAQTHNVPALILTNPRTPPMAATATRWRVAPMPSAQHPIAANLPGRPRLQLSLERRRSHSIVGATSQVMVEWDQEARAFGLPRDALNTLPDHSWHSDHLRRWAL
ncbi:MAG: hypothetical protein AAF709_04300 [Pseudomonadota bacterium]